MVLDRIKLIRGGRMRFRSGGRVLRPVCTVSVPEAKEFLVVSLKAFVNLISVRSRVDKSEKHE